MCFIFWFSLAVMFEYDIAGIFKRNSTQVKPWKEMRCSVITMETVGQNFYQTFCFWMNRKNKRNCVSAACAAQEQGKYSFMAWNCNAISPRIQYSFVSSTFISRVTLDTGVRDVSPLCKESTYRGSRKSEPLRFVSFTAVKTSKLQRYVFQQMIPTYRRNILLPPFLKILSLQGIPWAWYNENPVLT
jgi:hypothetical protein